MKPVDHFNLRSFDLNLLVAFDALMQYRSVTKAAARLRIQQPAMSSQLSALRLLFADELFIRVGNVMQPTARAEALAPQLRQFLTDAQAAILTSPSFEPEISDRTFQLGFSCEELLIVPDLAASMRTIGPGMKLIARRVLSSEIGRELDEGKLDVAVGCYPPGPARYRHRVLFEQHLACCYNKALLDLPRGLSMQAYLDARHVFVSQEDDLQGCIGSLLTRDGHTLDIVLAVPEYLAALAAATSAPLVVTLPYPIADRYAGGFGLTIAPMPIEIALPPVSMMWSERDENEAARAWLRTEVLRSCRPSAEHSSAQAK
jgi:DNA-binding transcriptional LysR family regulator